MKTPIYDFLQNYSDSNTLRLHMPGHKGKALRLLEVTHDITEIYGADSLFEADGIINESEKNASKLFKTAKTCYSSGGSTLCIQTMLALAKQDKRNIIAVRNVHRSFLFACALLDIQPKWLYPKYSAGFLSGEMSLSDIENALRETENPCLYITSPDYLGKTADIKKIADLCHRYNGILIIDNAHGAHTVGTDNHPILCGADMCCDSAHKMLPALTGAAYLHIGNEKYTNLVKQTMLMFASTSPSYLIMASLDLCNDYIENSLSSDTKKAVMALNKLREKISKKYKIYNSEPFHLTLLCDGISLANQLRKKGVECEYADKYCIVLLFSPICSVEEIEKTADILTSCTPQNVKYDLQLELEPANAVKTIREAVFSDSEEINVDFAAGRICAAVNVPCPPAVPIAVSGEIITEKTVEIFKRYGILTVNVIK